MLFWQITDEFLVRSSVVSIGQSWKFYRVPHIMIVCYTLQDEMPLSRNYKSVDILAVAGLTVVVTILGLTLPPDFVPGRILTLALVLLLPGYSLTMAIFPNRSLEVPERLLFGLGLSFVTVIVGGLVLNWTPFGLRTHSWAVLLGGITLGASAVALIRHRGESIILSRWLRMGNIGLTFRGGLLLGMALVVLCGAFAISIIGAMRQPFPGYTQLWMLPKDQGRLPYTVQLGINDMESRAMNYRLVITIDGTVTAVWTSIDLNPNEQWERTLVLPKVNHAGAIQVAATLYRADAPLTVYRHTLLWLGP